MADRAGHRDAAHPHGHQEELYTGKGLPKNENRTVVEKKVLYTGSPFKSEYTVTKVNNKELLKTYAEMHFQHCLVSRACSIDDICDATNEYNRLMDKVKLLRKEIKDANGMAIPLPSNLKKPPKPKSKICQ